MRRLLYIRQDERLHTGWNWRTVILERLQRRTGSPHMQARNRTLWDTTLSLVPLDRGNITIQWQFTNRTGEGGWVHVFVCIYICCSS